MKVRIKVTSPEVAKKASYLLLNSDDPLVKSVSASDLGQAQKKVRIRVNK